MTTSTIALLMLLAGPAPDEEGDDILKAQSRTLAGRLAADGTAGTVAQAAQTEAGLDALREALESAVRWKTRSYEEGFDTHFESHFFSVDAQGVLTLLPERQGELAALAARLEEIRKLFDHLNQRADFLAIEIDETAELSKRVRLMWRSPDFRLAKFREIAPEMLSGEQASASQAMDEFFDALRQESFDIKDGKLHAKAGAFAEEGAAATPEDVDRSRDNAIRDFREARASFQDIVERCDDPAVQAVFDAPLLTIAVEEHRERLRESLIRAAHQTALEAFTRRYLTGTGEKLQWRPDRAAKAEEILARTREIAKEKEAEAREEAKADAGDKDEE